IYSLLALPLLTYLRSERSEKFKQRVFAALSSPAGVLFVPSTLMLLSQIILRPFFPEETHDLIKDWAYFTFYFSFFIFGILCYSNANLWSTIGQNRKYLLVALLFVLIPFYTCYFHFRELIVLPWSMDTVETIFDVTAIFVSWFTVITIIAYGQHHLNKPHKRLTIANEGLYPF